MVPVITSSMAVITVEMVITILGTDFHCNFCKRHPSTRSNDVSVPTQNHFTPRTKEHCQSWLKMLGDDNLWALALGCICIQPVETMETSWQCNDKSAMLWIFLLYGAHKRLLAQCKAAYWSSLLFTAFSLECMPAVQWKVVCCKRERGGMMFMTGRASTTPRSPFALHTVHNPAKARQGRSF